MMGGFSSRFAVDLSTTYNPIAAPCLRNCSAMNEGISSDTTASNMWHRTKVLLYTALAKSADRQDARDK